MNRNQYNLHRAEFILRCRFTDYKVTYCNGHWFVERENPGPGVRARTEDRKEWFYQEVRLRQFVNETRAKEILIAYLVDKDVPIGVRPANKKSRKKVNKLRA